MPEGTYVELVASLSSTLLPTSIMAVSFLAIGLVIAGETPDRGLDLLIIAGSIAAAARLAVLLLYRKRVHETLSFAKARRLERLIALADAALCSVKRKGGGIAAYHQAIGVTDLRLSA